MTTLTLACFKCGTSYETKRRKIAHFCKPCGEQRNRDKTRDRMATLRSAKQTMHETLDDYIDKGMDTQYVEDLRPLIDMYAELISADMHQSSMTTFLIGTSTPAGPDEGTSTYYTDLKEELEYKSDQIAKHPWFADNPHWSFGLSE